MLNEQATQAERDALRERLGLDQQLRHAVRDLRHATPLQGDFGISYRNQQDVMPLIAERFPATLELVLVATIVALAIGIPLGVYAAIRKDSSDCPPPAPCSR